MSRRPVRPAKRKNLKQVVAECLATHRYRFTRHAIQRQSERGITQMEVRHVLLHGRHEPDKDQFDEDFSEWNYAMRGRTVDKRNLRIVISFDLENMLVITVIDLDRES